jgi:hypothetical protein
MRVAGGISLDANAEKPECRAMKRTGGDCGAIRVCIIIAS